MPSPHVWPAVMAAGRGPAGRLAGHAHTGSRGLHTAARSACEHVRRWKTLGSDDPAPEVVQCEPCGFLLVRDLLVQTRLQRA